MLPEWASVLAAKAKVAGLLAAAVAAGGVGGAVALSHVAPVSQQVVNDASTSPSATADPESGDAQDPETTQSPDPETTDAGSGQAQDPKTPPASTPPACPGDVK